MSFRPIRVAVRAVLLHRSSLLLVNAYPGEQSDLWCAPGGGAEPGESLTENLQRELHEECGIRISVGQPCLVNEFHDPPSGFHQVEIFFRCRLDGPLPDAAWTDHQGIVNRRGFFARDEMAALRFKPDSLPEIAWGNRGPLSYDPLERIVP